MEDDLQNCWTYELPSGQMIKLDRRAVADVGAAKLMRSYGIAPFDSGEESKMLPVYQGSRKVGILPSTFDPLTAKSSTFLYDVRAGDFKRDGDRWIACKTLGPGDLDALSEFRRVSPESKI